MRVTAAALTGVVETTPTSVKIAVRRAPASSIARMSRRRETPVVLRPSTASPAWVSSRTSAQAAAVLPAFMHEPTMATTGTPRGVERRGEVERHLADLRRLADALAEVGEAQHGAEHLAVEGRAEVGVDRVADAEHAAQVEQVDRCRRCASALGRWPE